MPTGPAAGQSSSGFTPSFHFRDHDTLKWSVVLVVIREIGEGGVEILHLGWLVKRGPNTHLIFSSN